MSMNRDWLAPLPRESWPEPWRSMDTAAPVPRPNDLADPEADDRLRIMLVPVPDPREEYKPLIAALEQFGVSLRRMRAAYSEIKTPTHTNRRFAAHYSLVRVIDLIDAVFPDGRDLTQHLKATMAALADIEEGRIASWLVPAAIGGRPAGVGITIASWRGRYAAIVELLHREGRHIRDAAKDVKKKIPDKSPVWGSGTPSWEAVKRWRDYDVKVEGSFEKEGYEAGLAFAERFPDLSAMETLRRMPQVGV